MGDQLGTRHRPLATKHSAFTLIELLVVIGVIAVLLGILLPVTRRVRSQARAIGCLSNLRQWGTVLNVYAIGNEGHLPFGRTGGVQFLQLLRGRLPSAEDPNGPGPSPLHFETGGLMLCPSARKPWPIDVGNSFGTTFGTSAGTYRIEGRPGRTFHAWLIDEPTPQSYGSYGYNGWVGEGFSELRSSRSRSRPDVNPDVLAMKGRAKIPLLLDSTLPWMYPHGRLPPPRGPDYGEFIGACINRHNGYVNGLFLDWSARKVGLKELWTLKWYKQFDTANPWTKAGGVQPEDWPKWMQRFKDY